MLFKVEMSCGVLEIKNLAWSNATQMLHEVLAENKSRRIKRANGVWSTSRPAHIVFSDYKRGRRAEPYNYGGHAFADYITANNLGRITVSPGARNTNSGNTIYVWVWTVDWKALRAWGVANPDPYEVWRKLALERNTRNRVPAPTISTSV